jgi:hypothetical protein
VEVRVHLYQRSFPEEPDINANNVDSALNTGGGFGGVTDIAPVLPDNRDMHVGRERPPEGRAWGEEGGSQMGVAHAQVPRDARLQRQRGPRQWRHKAPPAPVRSPLTGKNIDPRSAAEGNASRGSCKRADCRG